MEAFMTIKEMTQLVGPELKKVMDKKNRLAYPLLQWYVWLFFFFIIFFFIFFSIASSSG